MIMLMRGASLLDISGHISLYLNVGICSFPPFLLFASFEIVLIELCNRLELKSSRVNQPTGTVALI